MGPQLLPCQREIVRVFMILYNTRLKEASRELRANMTVAEKRLWERISRGQIKGYRFCRQKPIGNYIVDFYCLKAKLVIEVDGGIHLTRETRENDRNKDEYLKSLNLNVLRITNDEVLTNIEGVIHEILNKIPLCPPYKGD
jgi:very-short-patch-repair endonuclease